VTSLNATRQWTLRVENDADGAVPARQTRGTLAIDGRSIDIVDSRSALREAGPLAESGVEFFENGRLMASIGDGVYLFRSNLDPELKLVLAAAMEVASFRYRQ
jgi:hypothetical protein